MNNKNIKDVFFVPLGYDSKSELPTTVIIRADEQYHVWQSLADGKSEIIKLKEGNEKAG
jgi:hypothetical protein